MGNFCEQYGILPMAPSQRKYVKHKREKYDKQRKIWKKRKNFQPNEHYNKTKRFSKKSNKNYKKFDKKKTKCFKCGKYGHFANDCKVKQKINQLQINDKEKEELYNLLELKILIVKMKYHQMRLSPPLMNIHLHHPQPQILNLVALIIVVMVNQ